MQDNAPIHIANVVRQFIADYRIMTINWPPYSSDLNPIEHLWWMLKKLMFKHYLKLATVCRVEEE